MKVLFLVNLPSPYRAMFFAELGRLCDLTVIYERKSASDRNEKWKADTENTYRAIFLNGKEIGTDNSFCPEIIKYLKKEKYDRYVIGMYSTFTAMLAITYLKWKSIPFLLSTDGGFISKESKIKYQIKKHFIGAASYWLSTGDAATEYLAHYGANKDKTYTYPFTSLTKNDLVNAKRISTSNKKQLKEELEIMEEKIILSVGRFSYELGYGKGYDTLMRVAEKLDKSIGIYMVGDEPTDEFIRWKERAELTNVHFVGFKSKENLAEYYAVADLFVLMTKKDAWGLVINEAMSFGLPIITTKQCLAGLELVEDGINGFLLEAGDDYGVLGHIEKIIYSSEVLLSMGNKSFEKIQKYTIENMAIRHAEIFNMGNNEATA